MTPKFEEKTFENFFNSELDRRSSVYFPFGQVQEGGIGADSSAMSKSQKIWRILGYPRHIYHGVFLEELAAEMEDFLGTEIDHIPRMKVNLLFQYKRPERIASHRGREWLHWNEPYFRYDIYQQQQVRLAHIARKFGDRALVLYAAPAIADVNELVEAKKRIGLIESTNFRPAIDLANHRRNTFTKAGIFSFACSQPERLERYDLLEELDKLDRLEESSNRYFIQTCANKIIKAISLDSELGEAFQEELAILRELELEEFPLVFAILSMSIFSTLSGVRWVVATDPA